MSTLSFWRIHIAKVDSKPQKAGLRERNKQQKFERIKQAAWDLFREKGFEDTTTREIAERAEVGNGTLFLYVTDKYQLLQVVFGDALDRKTEAIFAYFPDGDSLVDELMTIFGQLIDLYAQEMSLAREFIKELYRGEVRATYTNASTLDFIRHIAGRIERAQDRGEIAGSVDAFQAAGNFFALYFFALMLWLGGWVDGPATRDVRLRSALELQIQGLLRQK
jgi:TetR/AcrR family transcriptional regulator, cholesterol catabolism regulator